MIGVAQIHGRGPATLIRLEGEAGMPAVDSLAIVFARLAARRVRLVVVDLAGRPCLSRLALGALDGLRRDLGRWGGRLRLAATPPRLPEALQAAGLTDLFDCYRTVEAALAAACVPGPPGRCSQPNGQSHAPAEGLAGEGGRLVAAGGAGQGPPEEPTFPNWVRYLYSDRS
jgi:anti-anti-sigma factor